jgi:two-component system phosphate regulon response regulator PhoB
MHVLVIDSDPDTQETIGRYFSQSEFHIHSCEGITSAKKSIRDLQPDCVIVDWTLPDGPGLDLITWLRRHDEYRRLPVLMLSSQSEESKRVTGLESGADDYMTKPPSLRELRARLKALIRRASEGRASNQLELFLDMKNKTVLANNKEVEMSKTEFNLFTFLTNNLGQVFSREQILHAVWGLETDLEARTVDVCILRLRKTLKSHNLDKIIRTVRGEGYKLRSDIIFKTSAGNPPMDSLQRQNIKYRIAR